METLKFKTNINCSGCVARVTPTLNNIEEIVSWTVNTSIADKVMEVKSENISSQEIIDKLQKAGFKAEKL